MVQERMQFNPTDLIARKRDGHSLSTAEIQALIDAYTAGLLPDYQMSAFMMAAYLNGMDDDETVAMTSSMIHSGEVLDLSGISGVKVDKHSTGGVGDKVSLILAPLVAACGVPVPMISGRGLGHSGGTLDKLESIPGFRVDLSASAYKKQLAEIDVVMIGQTKEIAPADRKMYALRDVTATIDFIPFIAPSILSKKIAAGIDALVLDVKCGDGAFMKTPKRAKQLAETLVSIGETFGKPTVALMTAMDEPLGYAVGNWPEVEESIACLRGASMGGLLELTLSLAGEMLCLGGMASSPAHGYEVAETAIKDGRAYQKLLTLVRAQGGDVRVIEDPHLYPKPALTFTVDAPADAGKFVAGIDALEIGRIALDLGAGRIKKEDDVDAAAGLRLALKVGDPVTPQSPLAELYADRPVDIEGIRRRLQRAFIYTDKAPKEQPVIMGRYTKGKWTDPQGVV